MPKYHIIVYVPVSDAERIRSVMTSAGVGKMGNYDSCSFSVRGTGRFRPLKGAHPTIGTVGTAEEVEEERIEAILETPNENTLKEILRKIRTAHPYEEPAIHVLPMIDENH